MKYISKNSFEKKSNSKSNGKDSNLDFGFKIEEFFTKNKNFFLYGTSALALFISFLLFNPDVSVGGDDSAYIKSAYNFANGISFPTWQGPFYPIVLSPFIKIAGVNLILLKILSVLFFVGSIFLSFKIFEKNGELFSAVVSAFVSAFCFTLCTYASTTYSEPLFMFLQSVYIFFLLWLLNKFDFEGSAIGFVDNFKRYGSWLALLAMLTYIMYQTRSLAIIVIPFTIGVLILDRRYLQACVYVLFSAVAHFLNWAYRSFVWNVSSVSFSSQLDSILLVNPYKPQNGYENFVGFCKRFLDNSQLYFSKHFLQFLGFKNVDDLSYNPFSALFIWAVIIVCGIYVFKHNRKLFYLLGYLVAMIVTTFVMIQKIWDQERLIMIYFPFMVGLVFYCLWDKLKKSKFAKFVVGLAVLIFTTVSVQTLKNGNFDVSDNFSSGVYASYTDDWRNYMLASKWAGENLPDSSRVLCRKPDMSWIASGGKNFFVGVNKLYTRHSDSMKHFLFDSLKVSHSILANLRLNPYRKDGRTITTVKYSLSALTAKYPFMLRNMKTFGTEEPAFVFAFDTTANPPLENLDCAVYVNPENLGAWQFKIEGLIRKGDFDGALKQIDECEKFNSGNNTVGLMRAGCLISKHDYDGAILQLDKILAANPKDDIALLNKSVAYFYKTNFKEAKKWLEEAKKCGVPMDTYMTYERDLNSRL